MTKKKSPEKSSDQILRAVRGEFYKSIADVLHTARSNAYRAVNFVMVEAYWNVGRMIVEEEQQGKERAGYGEALIRSLSEQLTLDFGKGFGVSNLFAFRQFYLAFPIFRTPCGISGGGDRVPENQPEIRDSLRPELSWSHYRLLIRVEKQEARTWYNFSVPNHGRLWKTLMRAHLGEYEHLEAKMKQAAHNEALNTDAYGMSHC
jgi:hypothetical protein